MVGVLQIITYLLCVYLVFKGFEILQLAIARVREDRALAMIIGVVAIVVSVGAGLYFVEMIDTRAKPISGRTGP